MKEFFTVLKQIANASSKKLKMLVGASVAAGLLTVSLTALAGWNPPRSVFDWNNSADRIGSMNGPRMNAFINTPDYGDERSFFDARRSDQLVGDVYKDVLDDVTDGSREVVLRSYVHNGANQTTNDDAGATNGVAKNAKVRVDLPTGTSNTLRAISYISISNPAPGYPAEVNDTSIMTDDKPFSISYIPGSAKLFNKVQPTQGFALADSIVTTGAPLGYNAMNGDFPGCFEFDAIVEIRVKVNVPETGIKKFVKKTGQTNWEENVTVKPGEKVNWLVEFKNSGLAPVSDVSIGDKLPKHLTVVPNSVRWIFTGNDGKPQDVVQSDTQLFSGAYNFGTWNSGNGFFVRFETTAKDDFEGCEIVLTNVAFMRNKEQPGEKEDNAQVKIVKENCVKSVVVTKPTVTAAKQLPNTGPAENMAGIFGATTALGYIAHRIRSIRRVR